MGIAALGGFGGVLAGVGTGISVFSSIEANEARQQALQQRMFQNQLSANQKSLQRQRQLERIISSQNAMVGARNIDPASASFKAIQEDTFNQYAMDTKADNMSLSFQQDALQQDSTQSNWETGLGVFGSLAEGAKGIQSARALDNYNTTSLYKSSPSGPPQSLFGYEQYRRWKDSDGGFL